MKRITKRNLMAVLRSVALDIPINLIFVDENSVPHAANMIKDVTVGEDIYERELGNATIWWDEEEK